MKKMIGFFFLLFSLGATAQKTKPAFVASVQGGLLEGEAGSAFQLKAVNGFQKQSWFAGIGVGLDYYHIRSLPLFLDLRRSFGKGAKAPFVYANGGYHFPWLKTGEQEWNDVDVKGGLYMDAGIGYAFPAFKNTALFFSAGYSQKNYTKVSGYPVYIDIFPPPPMPKIVSDYKLRRFSIQTGLRF
jgi:hypothetical protein